MALLPVSDISSYWVDDVPFGTSQMEFIDETGAPVAISSFTTAYVQIYNAAGTLLDPLDATINAELELLDIAWGGISYFGAPGIYSLVAQFENVGGVLITAEPYRFVVQDMDGWLTLEQARQMWQDAPTDDLLLYTLLQSAKEQCIEYAPALGLTNMVPLNYTNAQLMQVRALYTSVIANQQDSVGVDGFQVRVFPLDWNIKALLRPKRAMPVVG